MNKPKDLPLHEIVTLVDEQIKRGHTIFQKFTCQHCGERQTMDEANTIFTSGHCEKCGKVSEIKACGFILHASGDGVADVLEQLAQRKEQKP